MTDKQKTKMLGLLKAATDATNAQCEALRALRLAESVEHAAHVTASEANTAVFEFAYALAVGDKLSISFGEIT